MDFDALWQTALKHTEIVRTRVQSLQTIRDTQVPYILLCESSINTGDTVARQGEVTVTRPSLIVPPNNPQFHGFEFDEQNENNFDTNSLINFLLVRGISLPSLNYDNKTVSMNIYEGSLAQAVKHYEKNLQQTENVNTGLIIGHEDVWQLSLLIFICSQVAKNLNQDINYLMREYKKRNNP